MVVCPKVSRTARLLDYVVVVVYVRNEAKTQPVRYVYVLLFVYFCFPCLNVVIYFYFVLHLHTYNTRVSTLHMACDCIICLELVLCNI